MRLFSRFKHLPMVSLILFAGKSQTVRFHVPGYKALALATGASLLSLWALVSMPMLYFEQQRSAALDLELKNVKEALFQYQVRYEDVYELSYPPYSTIPQDLQEPPKIVDISAFINEHATWHIPMRLMDEVSISTDSSLIVPNVNASTSWHPPLLASDPMEAVVETTAPLIPIEPEKDQPQTIKVVQENAVWPQSWFPPQTLNRTPESKPKPIAPSETILAEQVLPSTMSVSVAEKINSPEAHQEEPSPTIPSNPASENKHKGLSIEMARSQMEGRKLRVRFDLKNKGSRARYEGLVWLEADFKPDQGEPIHFGGYHSDESLSQTFDFKRRRPSTLALILPGGLYGTFTKVSIVIGDKKGGVSFQKNLATIDHLFVEKDPSPLLEAH